MSGCATLVLSILILSPVPALTSEDISLSGQMEGKHKVSELTSIEPEHPLPPLLGLV